ncbi:MULTISPECIES: hypothetical protein [unclassified Pseudofrankia]|uniref:hypothetical protein n=1 Tax=unclassified Pseudofrankia TaxID=2994372 RepID=UPI0008D9E558|nr:MULTISPECIES: hypothetical protein [unclassified Pseudofrankia]MDT3441047.1 hypothetical protein [Pseudofrankia sp. BMG5.37]OHV42591.1 hypothetical protein BCD48_30935 [Pseudofrankia sp. BMG5.36]
MSDAQLSVREFVAATSKAYPCLTVEADQWHEVGYFFDPIENVYAYYSIDRKDPQELVERFSSAEALLAARGADERVASWVGSFRLCAEFGERFVYYPASRMLQRFPVAASTAMTAEEGLSKLEGRPLSWLREQVA